MAWALELTPQGIRRAEVSVGEKRMWTTTVLLALAAIAWLFLQPASMKELSNGAVKADNQSSIAVLPFVNLSENRENEYFSDGLTETLLHMLAQVEGIKVVARTSSFAYKGEDVDVRKIASELGVSHVLEGSVQRVNNRVRITAQLINAADGTHVWSDNFDRKLTDVFAIQDEIATAVDEHLEASLLPHDDLGNVGTKNTSAYDLYLRALEFKNTGSHRAYGKAETLLKSALLVDPDFHGAQRELADLIFLQIQTGLRKDNSENRNKWIGLLRKAVEGNPADYLAAGMLEFHESMQVPNGKLSPEDSRLAQAVEKLGRLIDKAPNEPRLHIFQAWLLRKLGRADEAIETLNAALAVDPLNWNIHADLGLAYIAKSGGTSNVISSLERAIELNPDNPLLRDLLYSFLFQQGMVAQSAEKNAREFPSGQSRPRSTGRSSREVVRLGA